jgi:hypothetical protein
MAWTKLYQALPTHPKTLHLAELLGLEDTDLAWAKVARLWLWALDYCPDGRLTVAKRPMTDGQIARAANFNGDPTVFVRSLIEVGFIDTSPGGSGGRTLQLHDWEEYGGKLHEIREADSERKKAGRSGGRPSDVLPDGVRRGEEKRVERREERRGEGTPPSSLPSALETKPQDAPREPQPPEGRPSATPEQILAASRRWEPSIPEESVRREIARAARAGVSMERLLADVEVLGERMKIWAIVDNYTVEKIRGKNGNGHDAGERTNGNPTGYIPAVLQERREVVQKRQDEAREKCDAAINAMDPRAIEEWLEKAYGEAKAAKVPEGPARDSFVKSKLRTWAAAEFHIEGV